MTLHERDAAPILEAHFVGEADHVTSIFRRAPLSGCGVSNKAFVGNQAQVEPEFAVNAVDAFLVVFPAQDVGMMQVGP